MKIGYFYPSPPEIDYPEIKGLPPTPAVTVIDADRFPIDAAVALNFSMIDLSDGDLYAIHTALFINSVKQTPTVTEYTPFRVRNFVSRTGRAAERYSVLEPFNATEEGVYTFKIYLFDHHIDYDDIDLSLAVDSTECSILIAEGWR